MLAFADVMHLFAYELAGLGARRFPFALVLVRAFDRFSFRHMTSVVISIAMVALAEMGAVIAPPLPAFYAKPQTLEDLVDQSVGRALDLFGLAWRPVRRWGEDLAPIKGDG